MSVCDNAKETLAKLCIDAGLDFPRGRINAKHSGVCELISMYT